MRFLLALFFVASVQITLAQSHRPDAPSGMLPLGLRLTVTEANSPPGSCGCFQLPGGAADIAVPLPHRVSAVLEIAGSHAGVVPATTRGLSTITLLAGPRYSLPVARSQSIFVQGLFGAVRGFDAQFRRGTDAIDTATAFSYAIGGGYEFKVDQRLTFRPAQIDLLQTDLPNGNSNSQRNVRFGAGLVVSLHLQESQRQ